MSNRPQRRKSRSLYHKLVVLPASGKMEDDQYENENKVDALRRLTFPVSMTYLMSGMVNDVSATLVATTQSLEPFGGCLNTSRCLSGWSMEYNGRQYMGWWGLAMIFCIKVESSSSEDSAPSSAFKSSKSPASISASSFDLWLIVSSLSILKLWWVVQVKVWKRKMEISLT